MKAIALGLVFVFAIPAFANTTTFSCELTKVPGEKFSFRISNLETRSAELVHEDPEDDYSKIISTTSKDETIEAMIGSLEGQGGDLRLAPDRITLIGDGDGIDMAEFVLFKKSNYKSGYVRWDFAGEKGYSKLSCDIMVQ